MHIHFGFLILLSFMLHFHLDLLGLDS
jgi:hypothetical protein